MSRDKRGGRKRKGVVGSIMEALDKLNRELWAHWTGLLVEVASAHSL